MHTLVAAKTKIVTAAQWLWNAAMAANPIGLAVAAIAALGAAIYTLTKYFNNQEAAIKKQNTALDGTVLLSKEARDEYNANIEVLNELGQQYDVLTGKMTEFQKQIKDLTEEYVVNVRELQDETQEKLNNVGSFWRTLLVGTKEARKEAASEERKIEIGSLEKWSQLRDIRIAKEKLIRENEKKENEKAANENIENAKKEQKQRAKDQQEAYKQRLEKEKEFAANENIENAKKEAELEASLERETLQQKGIAIIRDEYKNKGIEKLKENLQEESRLKKEALDMDAALELEIKKTTLNTALELTQELANYLVEMNKANLDAELSEKRSAAESEKEILKDKLDKGLISESDYKTQVAKIDKKFKYEEAVAARKQAIFQAIITTALAVIKALASTSWPLNLVAAASVAVLGGIQIAAISSKPLPSPGYGKGTSDIVSIGDSHASGNDVDVWGFSGGKKQFFGRVEKGEAMPVIRKSAANDYLI
jgi:DNA repair exonuclease SbcCD ATPase subunit